MRFGGVQLVILLGSYCEHHGDVIGCKVFVAALMERVRTDRAS